jgi:hypothetical protein
MAPHSVRAAAALLLLAAGARAANDGAALVSPKGWCVARARARVRRGRRWCGMCRQLR